MVHLGQRDGQNIQAVVLDKTTSGDCQSSEEKEECGLRRRLSMTQECSQVKENHTGTKAAKKARKREEDLVTEIEELKCQVKTDKGTKTYLKDSFRAWMNICNKAEVFLEQERLQEDELRQCFEQHKETWEPAERKTEAIAEKAWR